MELTGTYRRSRIALWVLRMISVELDGAGVQSSKKLLGEGKFRHAADALYLISESS